MAYGKVIGIYSSIPGQGKSEVRKHLVAKHGFRHLPFGRVVRRMLMTFLVEYGYPEVTAQEYIDEDRDTPLARVPGIPTVKHLSQTLTTSWGRNEIHPGLWTMDWECKAGVWSRSGVGVVADDMSTPSEVEAVKRLGGQIWRIERTDATISNVTASYSGEGALNGLVYDRLILNDGTLARLSKKVDKALLRTGKRCNEID